MKDSKKTNQSLELQCHFLPLTSCSLEICYKNIIMHVFLVPKMLIALLHNPVIEKFTYVLGVPYLHSYQNSCDPQCAFCQGLRLDVMSRPVDCVLHYE